MKKIMYLLVGLLVAAGGGFLIYLWFGDFLVVLKGLLGPMVVLAGAIVFIIGLMTPLKEEDLFPDDLESCDEEETGTTNEAGQGTSACPPCSDDSSEISKTD